MLGITLQMRWTGYNINSLLLLNVCQNIRTDAQYVTLQIKIRWINLLSQFQFYGSGWKQSKQQNLEMRNIFEG